MEKQLELIIGLCTSLVVMIIVLERTFQITIVGEVVDMLIDNNLQCFYHSIKIQFKLQRKTELTAKKETKYKTNTEYEWYHDYCYHSVPRECR